MVIFHSYGTNYQRVIFLEKKRCPFKLFKAFKADLQQPIFPAELLGASSDQLYGYVSQTGKHHKQIKQ